MGIVWVTLVFSYFFFSHFVWYNFYLCCLNFDSYLGVFLFHFVCGIIFLLCFFVVVVLSGLHRLSSTRCSSIFNTVLSFRFVTMVGNDVHLLLVYRFKAWLACSVIFLDFHESMYYNAKPPTFATGWLVLLSLETINLNLDSMYSTEGDISAPCLLFASTLWFVPLIYLAKNERRAILHRETEAANRHWGGWWFHTIFPIVAQLGSAFSRSKIAAAAACGDCCWLKL